MGPPADTISPRLAVYFGPLVPPRLRSADGYGSELCWWFEVKEFLVIEVLAGVQAEVQAGHCPGFEGNRGTATERGTQLHSSLHRVEAAGAVEPENLQVVVEGSCLI